MYIRVNVEESFRKIGGATYKRTLKKSAFLKASGMRSEGGRYVLCKYVGV